MLVELPEEILLHVFDLATDEDVIFHPYLPDDAFAQSAWFKNVFGDWALRTPQEALNLLQRRSYATKKAILLTCQRFRTLAAEFLFRSLFFDAPSRLYNASYRLGQSAKRAKDTKPGIGWWTRRVHLARYYAPSDDAPGDALFMESSLISMLNCCPNLEIFIISYPLGSSFGPVASALASSASRTLRTVHWSVPSSQLPKVIWALDSLPSLESISLDFSQPQVMTPDDEEDPTPLGAASGVTIQLNSLDQLLLKGELYEFVEQAAGWSLPTLRRFSLQCGLSGQQEPDIIPFLRQHGLDLLFLGLDCIPELNVPQILELCPSLTGFAMNADWRLPSSAPGDPGSIGFGIGPKVVIQPHKHLQFIGLYGLSHAFGTGYAAALSSVDPVRTALLCRHNGGLITTLAKLKRCDNLPNLVCVRALSRSLLTSLEKNGGPGEGEPMERWDEWYGALEGAQIRFEDCTGNLLGDLPDIEGEDSEDEEDSESEDEDNSLVVSGGMVSVLQELVEECQIMASQRQDGMFTSMAMEWQGGPGLETSTPLLLPASTSTISEIPQ